MGIGKIISGLAIHFSATYSDSATKQPLVGRHHLSISSLGMFLPSHATYCPISRWGPRISSHPPRPSADTGHTVHGRRVKVHRSQPAPITKLYAHMTTPRPPNDVTEMRQRPPLADTSDLHDVSSRRAPSVLFLADSRGLRRLVMGTGRLMSRSHAPIRSLDQILPDLVHGSLQTLRSSGDRRSLSGEVPSQRS